MASIEKKTLKSGKTVYRVKVRIKGFPVQSATRSRLTEARKWAAETEAAINAGKLKENVHTFGAMIDRYIQDVLPRKTESMIANQKPQLEWFKSELGDTNLEDVTPPLLCQCRDKLLATKSAATTVRYLAALSAVYTVAVNEWEWIDDSPLRKVKKPKESRGRVRYLNDEERARLLAACKNSEHPWLYTCVILALSTGMRKSELLNLRWYDVNLIDGFIILQETKNGERGRVPLAGLAYDILKVMFHARQPKISLLFPDELDPAKPTTLRWAFEKALKEAGIEDFHWHDLRHCTASYLAMNGASLAEIAEILRHKTLAMVKRYAHLSDGHVSSVVGAMNEKIFGELRV